MQEQITMNEKIIIDMKRELDAIINWMVDLKVQHLKDKIQAGEEALSENKWLKKQLDQKEVQIKKLQSWVDEARLLFKKLEEDGIVEQFDDWDSDEMWYHWYHTWGYVYKGGAYEFFGESW